MEAFQWVLVEIEMHELEAQGSRYIWMNQRRETTFIMECLDRFVGNQSCRETYPNLEAFNLEFYGSDHHLVKLVTQWRKSSIARNCRFQFENKWVLEADFIPIV